MGDLEKSLRRCFAKKTRHHSRVVVEVECYDEFDEKLGFKVASAIISKTRGK